MIRAYMVALLITACGGAVGHDNDPPPCPEPQTCVALDGVSCGPDGCTVQYECTADAPAPTPTCEGPVESNQPARPWLFRCGP